MPVLDTLKSALTDHLSTLVTRMTLGSTGGDSSSKDGGAGNPQITVTPNVRRIDDRTLSVSLTAGGSGYSDGTLTASNLLVMVPLLSSAARIPLPLESIFNAILLSSDILV